jgi:hypothetical protein
MKSATVRTKLGNLARALLLYGFAALPACGHSQQTAAEPGTSSQAAGAKAAGGHGSAMIESRPTGKVVKPKAPAPEAEQDPLEQDALAALDRMGAFLSSLQEFAVRAETTKEEVLESGQKLQFAKSVDLWVKRPNALRADVNSDRQRRQFFYDGKTFALYSPRLGYYASVAAPPTIGELVGVLQERYGVEMPLVDLFHFGTDPHLKEAIRSAIDVGPATIGGADTEHYAYRQLDVDWQIWIEHGETPLPRKFVITTREEPSEPQFVAVLTWNLTPNLHPKSFTFVPPADAKRIVFEGERLLATPPSQGAK